MVLAVVMVAMFISGNCNRKKSKGTQQGHIMQHNDGTRLFSGFLVSFAGGVVKKNCWMKQQSNTQKQGRLWLSKLAV